MFENDVKFVMEQVINEEFDSMKYLQFEII